MHNRIILLARRGSLITSMLFFVWFLFGYAVKNESQLVRVVDDQCIGYGNKYHLRGGRGLEYLGRSEAGLEYLGGG